MLGRSPGSKVFYRLNENPDSETYPGLVIIRFDGPLCFATANALRDRIREVTIAMTPPVTMVLIDMEGVNYLDLEGCDMLKVITRNMKGVGVEIHLARVKQEVMELLEKDGVDQIIGRDYIHNKAVEAAQLFTQKAQPVAKNDQSFFTNYIYLKGALCHACFGRVSEKIDDRLNTDQSKN